MFGRWVVTGPAGAASLMVTPWPGGIKHCPVGASPGGGERGSIYVCSKGLIIERRFNVS